MPARLAPAASRGLTVVTPASLRRLGLRPALAEREVRAGRWQRLCRGCYLPHDRPPTDRELLAAARAYLGDDHVVTGPLVLRALGLRWLPPADGTVSCLLPRRVDRMSSGVVRVSRTVQYDDLDTWVLHGSRMASPARAVVDTGRRVPTLRDVRGVVLGAAADGWCDADDVREVLASGQRNGSALVRRAALDAERGCASPPEAELVDGLVGRGVPFYVNPRLELDGRLIGIPDVWLVGRGVGGEVESRERHELAQNDVESTYDRHERFVSTGLDLVHVSVRRVRADVGAAATLLLGRAPRIEPPGLVVRPRGPLLC